LKENRKMIEFDYKRRLTFLLKNTCHKTNLRITGAVVGWIAAI